MGDLQRPIFQGPIVDQMAAMGETLARDLQRLDERLRRELIDPLNRALIDFGERYARALDAAGRDGEHRG